MLPADRRPDRRHLLAGLRILAAGALLAALLPAESLAAPPRSLRPGSRPGFVDVSAGPVVDLSRGGGTQLRLRQFFGWHLDGDAGGPALGVGLSQALLSGDAVLEVGVVGWWAIRLHPGLGLYLAPFIEAGVGGRSEAGERDAFFRFEGGLQLELIVGDRGKLILRPATIDVIFPDEGPEVRVAAALGAGVIF